MLIPFFYDKLISMKVRSITVNIPNNGNPNTKYIENELTKLNICPLRWAIVHVSDKMYKVSVAKTEK